nr:unnamed protein product [Callosobruchus chinensis]
MQKLRKLVRQFQYILIIYNFINENISSFSYTLTFKSHAPPPPRPILGLCLFFS